MTKCPNCNKRDAVISSQYGVTFCKVCRRSNKDIPKRGVEFTTESIKSQRREYYTGAIQPFDSDGTFSAEYYDAYKTRGVEVSDKQIKDRKYVWKSTKGWWNKNKSKK